MGSLVLLDLLGGVALLLWGLRPHRRIARVRPRFAPPPGQSAAQSLHRGRCRARLDRAVAKQHRDRPHDHVARGRRNGRPGAGACHHAWRQCRHHADRPASLLQHLRGGADSVHHRGHHLPRRRGEPRPRAWPHLDRAWADTVGAAHSHRYAGAGRAGASGARAARLHHQRSGPVHRDRGGADLGPRIRASRSCSW